MTDIRVRTVTSGTDYYATVDGTRFRLMLSDGIVWVSSTHARHGGYDVSRFGGELTPQSIRVFVTGGR